MGIDQGQSVFVTPGAAGAVGSPPVAIVVLSAFDVDDDVGAFEICACPHELLMISACAPNSLAHEKSDIRCHVIEESGSKIRVIIGCVAAFPVSQSMLMPRDQSTHPSVFQDMPFRFSMVSTLLRRKLRTSSLA